MRIRCSDDGVHSRIESSFAPTSRASAASGQEVPSLAPLSPFRARLSSALRRAAPTALIASVAALANTWATPALAQDRGFYLDRAQISGAPDDPFMTWRPYFSNDARFYGSATLGYSLNPLRIDTLVDDQQIEDRYDAVFGTQLIAYLGAGLQINRRVGLDVMLPIAIVSSGGEDPAADDVGNGTERGAGVFDTRASLRFLAYESDDKKLRWGGGGALFFPTGNAIRYTGDHETTSWIFTNLEMHTGDAMFLVMVGPQFRPTRGPNPSTLQAGNELRYSVGGFLPIYDERTSAGLEVWGQTGLHDVESVNNGQVNTEFALTRLENNSLEWLLQFRRDLGDQEPKSWYFQAGGGTLLLPGYGAATVRLLAQVGGHLWVKDIGPDDTKPRRRSGDHTPLEPEPDQDKDGFPDAIDQCPTIKEDGKPPFPDDGCPDLDQDDDGIPDKIDKCPTVKEDKDGIEDEDGCPEDDADKDGILDVDDACPLVKGIKHDNPKKNGCPPEPKKIVVTQDAVELLEPVQFAYNDSRILPESFELLDEVYDLMRSRPGMRLGIYGHTDNQGAAAYNLSLSKRRAASVVKYLVDKGVSAELLESEGFGLEKPIAPNDTEAGRAKNRRVEFKILKQ